MPSQRVTDTTKLGMNILFQIIKSGKLKLLIPIDKLKQQERKIKESTITRVITFCVSY